MHLITDLKTWKKIEKIMGTHLDEEHPCRGKHCRSFIRPKAWSSRRLLEGYDGIVQHCANVSTEWFANERRLTNVDLRTRRRTDSHCQIESHVGSRSSYQVGSRRDPSSVSRVRSHEIRTAWMFRRSTNSHATSRREREREKETTSRSRRRDANHRTWR